MTIAAKTISEALGGKPHGDGFLCLCPGHEDKEPSLSVCEKDGKILVHCFAGCDPTRVIDALKALNLWHSKNGDQPQAQKPRIVATYDYQDITGKMIFQVCRKEPGKNNTKKDFVQRQPDGKGGWIWKMTGVQRVPYRLPEVLQVEVVAVVEGEKGADALSALGITATCSPGGAGKWRTEFRQFFQKKKVVILPDNDETGRDHAQDVAQNLHGAAAVVKVVELPGLPVKGDVYDWIKAGGTFEQLSDLVKSAPEWKPEMGPKNHDSETGIAQIAQLNQKHAVVMLGGKCVVMNETVEPIFNRPDINFSSTADFKTCYANRMIEIPSKRGTTLEPLARIWLGSPERRQYDGIVFAPGQDFPSFFNLYRGLAVKPAKGDWSLMRNHIKEVIATGNVEVFQYLLAWMARLVQDPGGERSGTSVVMRGRQGTGKGCFASQFGEIFGSHFLHITNPTHLVHRFNQHLKDALLVFVDEGIWAGDKTAEGILKGMVTEKYFMCEPKGKDAFPVKNHVHLIIASNSQWVVPAGLEERRFMVLDVSDKHIQDQDYFKAIFHQMDHGGREAMLYDLLETDLSGVDLRTIPRTEALLDQIVHTMSTAKKFWFERLRAGTLLDEHRDWEPHVIAEKLYRAYLEFAANCGERFRFIDKQFGKELRALCPGLKRHYLTIDAKRTWVLTFPDLATCRQQFEDQVQVSINWESDDDAPELPF